MQTTDEIIENVEQLWNDYDRIIIAIVAIIIVYFAQRIFVRMAKRSVSRAELPIETTNGLILGIRLGALFLVFTILTTYAGLSSEALALSGFLGAAIGFASAQTIGNVIAGIYVILTRPFALGEYVKIGGYEGIVREISLNYTRIQAGDGTKILVPNRNVVNQTLQRFKRTLSIENEAEEEGTAMGKAMSFLRESIGDEKDVYIYPFDVAVHASYTMKTALAVFDEVCKEWIDTFGYAPTYYISDLPSYQIKYKFFITVEDPVKILDLQPEFLKALIGRLEDTKE